MSLYNRLHGVNPLAGTLLTMLELDPSQIERFRDVYVHDFENGEFGIGIFARTGGGNREDYPNKVLTSHPLYVEDFDGESDNTYAYFIFKVDGPTEEVLKGFVECMDASITEKPLDKFKSLMEKLEKGDLEDPQVKKALEVGKDIFGKIEEAFKTGNGKVEV